MHLLNSLGVRVGLQIIHNKKIKVCNYPSCAIWKRPTAPPVSRPPAYFIIPFGFRHRSKLSNLDGDPSRGRNTGWSEIN
jgi:hypothetical protein